MGSRMAIVYKKKHFSVIFIMLVILLLINLLMTLNTKKKYSIKIIDHSN
jgi:hypothetical protein